MPLLFESSPPTTTRQITLLPIYLVHPQHDASVVEQQGVAAFDVLRQGLVGDAHALLVAGIERISPRPG